MKRKVIAVLCAATVASLCFAGCGSSSSSSDASTETEETTEEAEAEAEEETTEEAEAEVETDDAAAAPGEAAGFTEIPIFEGEELGGFISMNAVYFQPVPMTGGYEDISDYNLHLEADISALENDLGFGTGDWIPYLTVTYEVVDSNGETAAEGSFMPMSASDGPHYGANIYLGEADTYSLTISVSPQEDVYLIHTDSETGPGGTFDEVFADGALTVTYDGWDYAPQEW